MKVLSLFSGVGGFDLGLERAGMETVFQCEWDKHATKILEKHWPHIPRWDDVSTLTGKFILLHAPVIDVVAWGSPCQDLSVAGKRAGLEGARSGLFHEGVRIIKELRELTNGKYPRISIWENVAGALSSGKGADFGQVLTEMDEAGACFSEWRILDAQYFGVPQRRRRVFLISVFDPATAARCPDPLLPVSESVRRDTETGNTARQTVAGETSASFRSGGYWPAGANETEPVLLTMREGKPGGGKGPLLSTDKSLSLRTGNEQTLFQPNQEPVLLDGTRVDDVRVYDPPVQTLKSRMGTGGNNVPVIGFSHTQGLSAQPSEDAWPTLRTEGNGMAVAYSIREDAKANTFSATELDRANALSALRPSPQSHHAQMFIAEGTQRAVNDVAGCLRSGGDGGVPSSRGEHLVVAPSLTASNDPSRSPQSSEITQQVPAVHQATMAVRRLTPLECERLMGWPDDWTAGQPDTHRYKQCGNGVASPVATWIAQQLLNIDK